jgi:Holliday junction resolvase RusA-like endonuclease
MIIIHGFLYSSKNSMKMLHLPGRGFGRRMRTIISKSDRARREFEEFCYELLQQKAAWEEMLKGKSFPYRVRLLIFRKDRRRFDYLNVCQNLFDAMTKMHYWPDDDANHVIPVFEPYQVDPDNPRVHITLD